MAEVTARAASEAAIEAAAIDAAVEVAVEMTSAKKGGSSSADAQGDRARSHRHGKHPRRGAKFGGGPPAAATVAATHRRHAFKRESIRAKRRSAATFVRDVTLPDGTEVFAGAVYRKVWCVRNDSAERWSAVRVQYVGGKGCSTIGFGSASVPDTEACEEVEVEVPIVVPNVRGRLCGFFKLVDANGQRFGPRLWVDVTCVGPDPKSTIADPMAVQERARALVPRLESLGFRNRGKVLESVLILNRFDLRGAADDMAMLIDASTAIAGRPITTQYWLSEKALSDDEERERIERHIDEREHRRRRGGSMSPRKRGSGGDGGGGEGGGEGGDATGADADRVSAMAELITAGIELSTVPVELSRRAREVLASPITLDEFPVAQPADGDSAVTPGRSTSPGRPRTHRRRRSIGDGKKGKEDEDESKEKEKEQEKGEGNDAVPAPSPPSSWSRSKRVVRRKDSAEPAADRNASDQKGSSPTLALGPAPLSLGPAPASTDVIATTVIATTPTPTTTSSAADALLSSEVAAAAGPASDSVPERRCSDPSWELIETS